MLSPASHPQSKVEQKVTISPTENVPESARHSGYKTLFAPFPMWMVQIILRLKSQVSPLGKDAHWMPVMPIFLEDWG